MLREPIEVRTYGKSGHDVVVLHGGPGAPGSVASLAATLAPDHKVYEPWQRRGGANHPLTVESHTADLAVVAPERAVYVGCSWGAMLGLSFASAHPERVASLVLVGCGSYDEASREEHARRLRSRLGDAQGQLEDLRDRLSRAEDTEWRDDLLGQIGELVEAASAIDPVGSTAADTHPDADGHEETWSDAMRLQHEGIEPARFEAIQCPVLMLHGDDDPHPGTAIRDTLQRHIRHLVYVGFRQCGHVPWLEKQARDSFDDILTEWIADTDLGV